MINYLIYKMTDWLLINWLIDWLIDWLTDWLIDWLIDWLNRALYFEAKEADTSEFALEKELSDFLGEVP